MLRCIGRQRRAEEADDQVGTYSIPSPPVFPQQGCRRAVLLENGHADEHLHHDPTRYGSQTGLKPWEEVNDNEAVHGRVQPVCNTTPRPYLLVPRGEYAPPLGRVGVSHPTNNSTRCEEKREVEYASRQEKRPDDDRPE